LDNQEIVIVSEVKFLTKFPFSDSFKYDGLFLIKQSDNKELTIEYKYALEFQPSAMLFKGMIETNTSSE